MSDLVLHEPLASEVRRMAEIEGTTAEQVVAEAVRQYRAAARECKIRAEAEWWRNAAPELRARYTGQFVAVHEQQVIDTDPDQLSLPGDAAAAGPYAAIIDTGADGTLVPRAWLDELEAAPA
jgi:hypothetical protein